MSARKMLSSLVCVVAVSFGVAACSGAESADSSPLPGYPSLDLSTPSKGADAFIDAWTMRDFYMALQLHDARVQNRMSQQLLSGQTGLDWTLTGANPNPAADWGEHGSSEPWVAQALWAAAEAGVLKVDLAGASVVGETQIIGPLSEPRSSDVTIVLADGRPAVMRMVESPSGRWRLGRFGLPTLESIDVLAEAREAKYVLVDPCTEDWRVELIDGVACAILDESIATPRSPEVVAEIQRLKDEAGDDINQQIENAGLITELVNRGVSATVRQLCLIMQGHDQVGFRSADLSDLIPPASMLVDTTCAGDPARLSSWVNPVPTAAPMQIGEHETYGALDLSSPAAGVQTFVALVDARDFFVLPLAMSASRQRWLKGEVNRARFDVLRHDPFDDFEIGTEHAQTPLGLVAQVLHDAWEADDFIVDVRGLGDVGAGTVLESFGSRTDAVLIEAASSHHPEGLGFVMVPSPYGRWRVEQIATPASAIDPLLGLFVTG